MIFPMITRQMDESNAETKIPGPERSKTGD